VVTTIEVVVVVTVEDVISTPKTLNPQKLTSAIDARLEGIGLTIALRMEMLTLMSIKHVVCLKIRNGEE
jgi:hypothetical protein